MSLKIRFILLASIVAICTATSLAQNQSSTVEIKDDEFSGKRKVTLKEQQIAPQLKMTLISTVNPSRPRRDYEPDLDFAEITFISTSGKREYDGSDVEFNFLVDGTRVGGGPVKSSPMTDKMAEDGKEIAIGVIYLSSLDKIARGRDVRMKIGENVLKIEKTVLKNLQEFIRALRP